MTALDKKNRAARAGQYFGWLFLFSLFCFSYPLNGQVDKKKIKISTLYCSFSFQQYQLLFSQIGLDDYYEFEQSEDPEYVIYDVYKKPTRKLNGKMPIISGDFAKIFITGENFRPIMNYCDWAFTFDYEDMLQEPRHMRFPLYVFFVSSERLIKQPRPLVEVKKEKPKFCNYLYFHSIPIREKLFKKLSQYKKVDAPGKSMNNMPALGKKKEPESSRNDTKWADEKLDFINEYKFTIAFENESYPGYTTEKIVQPMVVGSIPIYWGNPRIGEEFNSKSFISYADFEKPIKDKFPRFLFHIPVVKVFLQWWIEDQVLDQMVKRIIEIDQDDALYEQYLQEPWFHNNQPNVYYDKERLKSRFMEIFG